MSQPTDPKDRLWLDPLAFSQQALLQGQPIAWCEPTAWALWVAKAHGLLGCKVSVIPLAEGISAWLKANPAVCDELRSARDPMGLVRKLCAHTAFTGWLKLLTLNLKETTPKGQVKLVLPAAAPLMQRLAQAVHGQAPQATEIDPEDAEDATVYLANALRQIPADAMDTLLVDGRIETAQGPADLLAGADTLANVAAHYQWRFGVQVCQGASLGALRPAFAIADHWQARPDAATSCGQVVALVDASAAMGTVGSATGPDFLLLQVPPELAPDVVIPQLRSLTCGA